MLKRFGPCQVYGCLSKLKPNYSGRVIESNEAFTPLIDINILQHVYYLFVFEG